MPEKMPEKMQASTSFGIAGVAELDAITVDGLEGGLDLNSKLTPAEMQARIKQKTIAEIPPASTGEPIIIYSDMTLVEALRFIAKAWIRACPVYDKAQKAIVGCLDLRDVCQFMVQMHKAMETHGQPTTDCHSNKLLDYIAERDPISLTDLAKKREFHVVSPSISIYELCVILSEGSHIVGISGGPEETAGISRIITQGMLFKYIARPLLLLDIPVSNVMTPKVISVKYNSNALKSFEIMIKKGISGLAVVDEDGILIHNTSTSDTKMLITAKEYENLSLGQTIEDFLVELRSLQVQCQQSHKTRVAVSCVGEEDQLKQAIAKLLKTGYHRVFVVNKVKEPVGVLSLSDIFRAVTSENPGLKRQLSLAAKQKGGSCHSGCSVQ